MRTAKSLLAVTGMAALVIFAAPSSRAQQAYQHDAAQAQQNSQAGADAQNSHDPADFDSFSDPAFVN